MNGTQKLALEPGEIHVMLIRIVDALPALDAISAVLSAEEAARAKRFVREIDRLRATVARGMLRRMLHAYTGTPPAELEFVYSKSKKPMLKDAGGIEFNLSHSGDYVLFGFAANRSIGVDIEAYRADSRSDGVAQLCFHSSELDEWRRQPVEKSVSSFYGLWTCKEAVLKASGKGLQMDLRSFQVRCEPMFHPVRFEEPQETEWSVRTISAPPNYAAAIAAQASPGASLRLIIRWIQASQWLF